MSRQFVIQGIEFRPLMWWGKKSKVKVKQLRIEYDMKSQTAMVGGVFALAPSYQWMWKWKKDAGRQRWRRRWKKRINLKSVFIEKYITEALRDAVCHFNCCSSYLRCPQMKYVQTDVGGPAAHTNYSRHVYYPQCDFIILFFFCSARSNMDLRMPGFSSLLECGHVKINGILLQNILAREHAVHAGCRTHNKKPKYIRIIDWIGKALRIFLLSQGRRSKTRSNGLLL